MDRGYEENEEIILYFCEDITSEKNFLKKDDKIIYILKKQFIKTNFMVLKKIFSEESMFMASIQGLLDGWTLSTMKLEIVEADTFNETEEHLIFFSGAHDLTIKKIKLFIFSWNIIVPNITSTLYPETWVQSENEVNTATIRWKKHTLFPIFVEFIFKLIEGYTYNKFTETDMEKDLTKIIKKIDFVLDSQEKNGRREINLVKKFFFYYCQALGLK